MQRFGEKLRSLRTKHGFSLRDMARELGYTNAHAYIGDLENGKRKPSLEIMVKVSNRFGLSVDQLLRDDLEIDSSESNP